MYFSYKDAYKKTSISNRSFLLTSSLELPHSVLFRIVGNIICSTKSCVYFHQFCISGMMVFNVSPSKTLSKVNQWRSFELLELCEIRKFRFRVHDDRTVTFTILTYKVLSANENFVYCPMQNKQGLHPTKLLFIYTKSHNNQHPNY